MIIPPIAALAAASSFAFLALSNKEIQLRKEPTMTNGVTKTAIAGIFPYCFAFKITFAASACCIFL